MNIVCHKRTYSVVVGDRQGNRYFQYLISKDEDNDRGLIICALIYSLSLSLFDLLALALSSSLIFLYLPLFFSLNNLCSKFFIYNSKCILMSENV